METIKYGRVGKQDLKLGRGTFEVTLGDGRVVTMDEINLDSFEDRLLSVEDASASSVTTLLTLRHTTSGTPAIGIGVGLVMQAESADEDPSDCIGIEGAFDTVTAAAESSTLWLKLRATGSALARLFGFRNTGSGYFLFSGSASGNRTLSLPDASTTIVGHDATQTLSNKTLTDAAHNAGSGSETFRANGHIEVDTGTTTATGSGSEENLDTYSLPADTLNANGKGVRIKAWGKVTAYSEVVKLYFGAFIVAQFNAGYVPGSAWVLEADVLRTGSSTQDAIGKGQVGAVAQGVMFTTPAEVETGAITIKITASGTNATTTQEGLQVEYING